MFVLYRVLGLNLYDAFYKVRFKRVTEGVVLLT